jgi:hypothetical protein
MKKLLSCMALLCLLLSCKKKTDDLPAPFVWPDGTGEYAPYTNGSTFVYEVRDTTPIIDSFTYTVVKDTLIGGLKFHKLQSSDTDIADHLYCHYANGVRTEIIYDNTVLPSGTLAIKNIVLKVNEALNTSWSNQINFTYPGLPFVTPMNFTYTLLQKGIIKNVLQKDYTETFEIKNVTSIGGLMGVPSYTSISKSFFSKNHGLIQQEDTNGSIKLRRSNIIK